MSKNHEHLDFRGHAPDLSFKRDFSKTHRQTQRLHSWIARDLSLPGKLLRGQTNSQILRYLHFSPNRVRGSSVLRETESGWKLGRVASLQNQCFFNKNQNNLLLLAASAISQIVAPPFFSHVPRDIDIDFLMICWNATIVTPNARLNFCIFGSSLQNLSAVQNFVVIHGDRSNVTIVSPKSPRTLKRYYSNSKCTSDAPRTLKRCYSKSKWILKSSRIF